MTESPAKPIFNYPMFLDFIALPENRGRLFETIHGEIIEVSPGRTSNSRIAHLIVVPVYQFCEAHGLPCYTSGEAGAYRIGDDVIAPDFAYKATPMSDDYPDPIAPAWVVEIISPTDSPEDVADKREIYVRADILYWEVYPRKKTIHVYEPGQPLRIVTAADRLDGGVVLPGFNLRADALFSD